MNRRRKINPLRLVLIILIILVLCVIAFFSIKLVFNKVNNDVNTPESNGEHTQDVISDSNEEVTTEIVNYTVYTDDESELGFNFILADIKFTSVNSTITYDLNNLSTADRVYLGSIREYEEKLVEKGYVLSKLGYVKVVRNDNGNSVTAKIFIPFSNNKVGELSVYNGKALKFNLYNNNVKASSLKLPDEVKETEVISDDYNLIVRDSYVETRMLRNGELATYPSSVEVYSYILKVNNVTSSLVVENAKFLPSNSSLEIEALEKEYSSKISENIIGKKLKADDEYALFFAITNSDGSRASFDGKLLIKFENNPTWLEISTVHN